ncbi:MAG: Rrf2 family transcriptional regulator [Gammaproteobacteria bacterium]|nr:Rrf2 family transcriptional regulator [Gammaproteobacteria bacterium]
MKISSKGRYAVAAMMDLALNENKGPITIADISEKQNISLSYLEQIFADLRKGGLVRGTRGPGGGYRLARHPENISVAEIIDVLNEKRPRLSTEDERYEPYQLWARLSHRMHDFLAEISLQECLQNGGLPGDVGFSADAEQKRAA